MKKFIIRHIDLACILSLLYCIGWVVIIAYSCINSGINSNWVVTFDFNVVNEGLIEAMLFIPAIIFSLIGIVRYIIKVTSK